LGTKNGLGLRIVEVVSAPADELLFAYFDPDGPFAGSTFDDLPGNPKGEFCASDLVAASLLDVRFGPRAVRPLLARGPNLISKHLNDISDHVDLWDATEDDLAPAYELWKVVMKLDGVGPTRTSKLLARKRPRLIPIEDSVIRQALPLGKDSWVSLRSALRDEHVRKCIEDIRPSGIASTISTLRLLDAAAWMRYSNSRAAKKARRSAGMG
jgi:hypothetical protein